MCQPRNHLLSVLLLLLGIFSFWRSTFARAKATDIDAHAHITAARKVSMLRIIACGGPVIGRRWSWSAGVGVFLAVLTAGEGFYRLRQYHAVYRGDGARYWDYGIRQALGRTRSVANADESIIISDSIMNGYMFFLFYSDGPYPTLRPEVTDFSGLLPSKFLVHGPVSPPPPGLKALWILRPQELSKHASGHVVETLSYPTGETCLFLVRETTE